MPAMVRIPPLRPATRIAIGPSSDATIATFEPELTVGADGRRAEHRPLARPRQEPIGVEAQLLPHGGGASRRHPALDDHMPAQVAVNPARSRCMDRARATGSTNETDADCRQA